MFFYPVRFTPEGKGFVVTVPDIPEVITEGESIAEATEYTIDAMELILGEYMRRRAEIPRPSKRKGRHIRIVELPLLTQAKLSLYSAMQASGIRKADLARRLGVSKPQVERLLDLAHGSRLEQIEQAFRALNKRVELSVRDAA
jgi:antitoxin HicB